MAMVVVEMNIGDTGEISFIFRHRRKWPIKDEPPYIDDGIICMARVTGIIPNGVKVLDNDGREYEIPNNLIRYFKLKN